MNESHERRLVSTFRYIDGLLSDARHILATADSTSPFAQFTPDGSPVQRKAIGDYIQGIGQAMARIIADLDLPRPLPVCGDLWAARFGR